MLTPKDAAGICILILAGLIIGMLYSADPETRLAGKILGIGAFAVKVLWIIAGFL